ncbi:MAG: hypothetical protein Udaeo2_32040 [Candidatus Udaeobacter sp.]|nr:MAG: hypothetical protein Udaeo2_32040 [Candidatus Udaeobacter sp.]
MKVARAGQAEHDQRQRCVRVERLNEAGHAHHEAHRQREQRLAAVRPRSKHLYFLSDASGEFTAVRRYSLADGTVEDVQSAPWDVVATTFSHNGRSRATIVDAADLVDAEVVRFRARDGMTVSNILWKPHQAAPTTKAPALVYVHGGPGGQTTPAYNALVQFLANHGYVGINNRGSSGYGKTFLPRTTRSRARTAVGLRRWQEVSADAAVADYE